MKPRYDLVFIVLVYRNTSDLSDFFKSNTLSDAKTIVVNSYYDEETELEFKRLAHEHCADFISVPNKGYGAGNNAGIAYAIENYSFKYLIVSNADITIEKFNRNIFEGFKDTIFAPKILTISGKNQNPSSPFRPSKLREGIVNKIYSGNHRHLIVLFYVWSRLSKIIYYLISPLRKKIEAPHGAFFIMPYSVVSRLMPIFNEKMFLFFEENHLGKLARKNNISIRYTPEIVIRHKEDGSINYLSTSIFPLMRQSYMEYYSYWNKLAHEV